MDTFYGSFRSSSSNGGYGEKGVEGGNRYFNQLRVSLYYRALKYGVTFK